jgi:hypothetical protein
VSRQYLQEVHGQIGGSGGKELPRSASSYICEESKQIFPYEDYGVIFSDEGDSEEGADFD